jgi:hypothetical protein
LLRSKIVAIITTRKWKQTKHKTINGVENQTNTKDEHKDTVRENKGRRGGNPWIKNYAALGTARSRDTKEFQAYRKDLLFDIMKAQDENGVSVRDLLIAKTIRVASYKKELFDERDDLKVLSNFLKILTPDAPKSVSVVKSEYHDHYAGEKEENGRTVIDISKMPGYSDMAVARNK